MTDTNIIESLIEAEMLDALKKHPEHRFTDWNHAFGAMHEELLEVFCVFRRIGDIHNILEENLSKDDVEFNTEQYNKMYNAALEGIQEFIQFAGVCRKASGYPIVLPVCAYCGTHPEACEACDEHNLFTLLRK